MLEVAKPIQSESLISLSFLRNKIPSQFQSQFVEDIRLCLDCGGNITEQDEELACSVCGRVWSESIQVENHTIPFETASTEEGHSESHWNPANDLAFGRNLGSQPLRGGGLYRVLAQSRNGKTDLGLRALQCQIVINKIDHPAITGLLAYASDLLKKHGLTDNSEQNLLYSNVLGSRLRRVGAYLAIRNERITGEPKRLVGALFIDIFRQVFPDRYLKLKEETAKDELAARLYWEIGCTDEEVQYYTHLLGMLSPPRKPKKTKQKKLKSQD